jgi:hypothetical protein
LLLIRIRFKLKSFSFIIRISYPLVCILLKFLMYMQRCLFLILFFLLSCGKKTDQKPNIFTLREMSDLATVEYTVTKIIKASDNKTWFKIGDRKILMSCEAHIKAGIDMSAINEHSFTINEKNIRVTLPPPKIISFSIPPEGIKTEYEETGVFRDKFKAADRDALAVQAEKQIRNSIESLGILQQAKVNASLFVTNFFKRLGYENISIDYNANNSLNRLQ